MKTRFIISKNDTVKATMSSHDGKLLSSVYDSQFTTINEVVGMLISKVPYTPTKSVNITIYNVDKDTVKYLTKKVNK